VALVIFVFMAVLSHMLVAAAAAVMLALYIGFASVVARRGDRRKTLVGGLKVYGLLGLTAGIMSAGYLAPFYAYGSVASREGLNTPAIHDLHRLPIAEFLGLSAVVPAEVLTRMQFPLVVVILAAVGLGLALLRSLRGDENDRKAAGVWPFGARGNDLHTFPLNGGRDPAYLTNALELSQLSQPAPRRHAAHAADGCLWGLGSGRNPDLPRQVHRPPAWNIEAG